MKTKRLWIIAAAVMLVAVVFSACGTKQFSVTFDLDGGTGTFTEQKVDDGSKATKPTTDPKKDGYRFDTWFKGETKFDFDTAITADTVLKATWIKTYSVTFDLDGGSGTFAAQTIDTGLKATEPTTEPKKDGYRFDGWFKGETEFDFDTAITTDTDLKAAWVKTYSVTFDVNGGEGTFAAQTIDTGLKATEPTAEPTWEKHRFEGWFNGETKYDFDVNVTNDVALKAKWTRLYSVTFELDGGNGTGDYSKQTVDAGKKASEPASDPKKDGYTFNGWYNGAEEFDFETAIDDDVELVANWLKTYAVTFDLNGGSGFAFAQTITHGKFATKPFADPTNLGHTFLGWFVGDSTTAVDFTTYAITEITEFKAGWSLQLASIVGEWTGTTGTGDDAIDYAITVNADGTATGSYTTTEGTTQMTGLTLTIDGAAVKFAYGTDKTLEFKYSDFALVSESGVASEAVTLKIGMTLAKLVGKWTGIGSSYGGSVGYEIIINADGTAGGKLTDLDYNEDHAVQSVTVGADSVTVKAEYYGNIVFSFMGVKLATKNGAAYETVTLAKTEFPTNAILAGTWTGTSEAYGMACEYEMVIAADGTVTVSYDMGLGTVTDLETPSIEINGFTVKLTHVEYSKDVEILFTYQEGKLITSAAVMWEPLTLTKS